MTYYKVELNIPIPQFKNGRKISDTRKLMESMNVGDSFTIPYDDYPKVLAITRRTGVIKFSIRRVDRDTYRCWRVA